MEDVISIFNKFLGDSDTQPDLIINELHCFSFSWTVLILGESQDFFWETMRPLLEIFKLELLF